MWISTRSTSLTLSRYTRCPRKDLGVRKAREAWHLGLRGQHRLSVQCLFRDEVYVSEPASSVSPFSVVAPPLAPRGQKENQAIAASSFLSHPSFLCHPAARRVHPFRTKAPLSFGFSSSVSKSSNWFRGPKATIFRKTADLYPFLFSE